MNFRENILKFVKLSLIFLFVGYYSSSTLFFHVHIINGETVVHSHFYSPDANDKTPIKKHSHPLSTFNLIQHFNKIHTEEIALGSSYVQPLFVYHTILQHFSIVDNSISSHLSNLTRGPPTC